MVFRRGILPVSLALCALPLVTGCQTSNSTAKVDSIAPSFGMDPVPRQTEPELDGVAVARAIPAGAEVEPSDDDEPESPSASQENLLTRLIPGRDKGKGRAERKSLPVSERSAAANDLDDLDF